MVKMDVNIQKKKKKKNEAQSEECNYHIQEGI